MQYETTNFTPAQLKLLDFVKTHHEGQKRKYTFEPYWHHLVNVAELVSTYAPQEALAVEVALCHDLLEDTACSATQLRAFLESIGYHNNDATEIVERVTDLSEVYTKEAFPDLNRPERKQLEADRLKTIRPQSQTVKYADIIDNLSTIAERDPAFARVYVSEKDLYIHDLNQGDSLLFQKALAAIEYARLRTA